MTRILAPEPPVNPTHEDAIRFLLQQPLSGFISDVALNRACWMYLLASGVLKATGRDAGNQPAVLGAPA